MKRFFTLLLMFAATSGIAATAWSQAGQAGGAGTAGGAGAGGGPQTTSGGATAGAPGTAGTPGAAGTSATAPGGPQTSGTSPVGPNGIGTGVPPGANPNGVGTAGAAAQANVNQNNFNAAAGIDAGFNGINQRPFFTDPGARRQLNMNDRQFNTLNRAYQDAYGRYNQNVNRLSNNRLTPQQRAQQMQLYENQFNTEYGQALNSTFTNPQYRTRYDQLNRQYMGFNAFNDQAIQRQLNLTPQQQMQIRQLGAEWRKQLMQAGRGNGTDTNLNNITPEQWSQMYSQYWDQLNALLTPEQQQTWSQLTGERYTFSPNLYAPQQQYTPPAKVNGTGTVNPGGNVKPNPNPPGGIEPYRTTPAAGNSTNNTHPAPQGNSANAGTQGGTTR
jgi:hypothetical protein